ncbi:MAG: CPBP family intramembrane glutamic endopeptidase [Myxococcota bacterium]
MTTTMLLNAAAVAAGPRDNLALFDGVGGALAKMALPLVAYVAAVPVFWLLFRRTWRQIDDEALAYRQSLRERDAHDFRPPLVLAIVAVVLTMQEYYGGYEFYHAYVRPWLARTAAAAWTSGDPDGIVHASRIDLRFYGELYQYAWWAGTRIAGYTVVPVALYKLVYRRDPLADVMALRTRELGQHVRIYGLLLIIIIPTVFVVAQSPDFANYYPFYKRCSRSWFDFLVWEALYLGQFFALEVFFRGFMLVPLKRTLGTAAVFAMCVPYVMIHFGKPYLEASSAFLAGVALGTLAMKTRSIYGGFLIHATVALLMDGLALHYGDGFPVRFWPR